MIYNPTAAEKGGGGVALAHLSIERIAGSRPMYWSVTFVDSDGLPHVDVSEGEFTVFLGSMVVTAGTPTSMADMSGVTGMRDNLYQVTSEQARFY